MKKKLVYLEILRIVAAFFVIINHTNAGVFQNVHFSTTWSLSILYFIICRAAVPIFFMISGALLISKSDSFKSLIKRIFFAFYPLLFASIFYYLTGPQYLDKSIPDFFIKLYSSKMTNALWYMYAYIALLMMLPFIQAMVQHFTIKMFYYYFGLTFFFSAFIPPLLSYFQLPSIFDKFQLPLLNMYLAYFIAGHFFVNIYKTKSKHYLFILFTTFFVNWIGTFMLIFHDYQKAPTGFFLFWNEIEHFNIDLMSISLFLIIKYIFENFTIPPIAETFIFSISQKTFGIYLISDYIIRKMYFIYPLLSTHMNKLAAMFILEVSIFTSCFTLVYLYQKSFKILKNFIQAN